eukprot:2120954-Amphidinium_carterae.3
MSSMERRTPAVIVLVNEKSEWQDACERNLQQFWQSIEVIDWQKWNVPWLELTCICLALEIVNMARVLWLELQIRMVHTSIQHGTHGDNGAMSCPEMPDSSESARVETITGSTYEDWKDSIANTLHLCP